jgi:hypothetical protein
MSDDRKRQSGREDHDGRPHTEASAETNAGTPQLNEDMTAEPIPPRRHGADVWKGIGLTALLHLIPLVFPVLYFFIGVAQLVYIIPALIICRKNTGMVQGLLIGAGITLLLNAACFGIMTASFR